MNTFKVVNQMDCKEEELPHTCSRRCLGPLAFHTDAVGDRITLTHGARRAERAPDTFRSGLVFSSRPVRIMEKVRLRVDHTVPRWHGALRLGFTNVKPAPGLQADMAIPNLTDQPGYWAANIHESRTMSGSQLQFWVTRKGRLMFKDHYGHESLLLEGLDIRKPLWAMIDVYGQTCAVALLGSEKKGLLGTQTSCHTCSCPPSSELFEKTRNLCPPITDNQWSEDLNTEESCVVCMSRVACVVLCCGHQCLCTTCVGRVAVDFGTCPLCRERIV